MFRVSLGLIEGWFRIRLRLTLAWGGSLGVIEADLVFFFKRLVDYLENVLRHQSHQRTEGPRDQRTNKRPGDQGRGLKDREIQLSQDLKMA